MMEKSIKWLRIIFYVFIALNTGLAIASLCIGDFNTALWMLVTSFWMWRYSVILIENARLRKDKWDMATLVFAQHEYMKRKIQEVREAARAMDENKEQKNEGEDNEEIRQGQ